jgi:feruloyl esterase
MEQQADSVGNGGWAGSIGYGAMATPSLRGTPQPVPTRDTRRAATFVVDHPEKVIDFSYRAVHEMAVAAKAINAAYYDGGPRLSYFQGCSTGGRQALTAAQRYPLDFDGIIAGATAVNASRLHTTQVWVAQQANRDEQSRIPKKKYTTLHNAVLEACDALDGVKDRVLENPRQCKFDPAVLLCKNGDSSKCLTAAQVETAKRVFAGTGGILGYEYGSEGGWNGTLSKPIGIAYDMYRYLVFENPKWNYKVWISRRTFPLSTKRSATS